MNHVELLTVRLYWNLLYQGVDNEMLAGLRIKKRWRSAPVPGWAAAGLVGQRGSMLARSGHEGARGVRQSSHFTGLIRRKDFGVSFWTEGKRNAWERAKGGSTPRWIRM